jgi:hypothetical protein
MGVAVLVALIAGPVSVASLAMSGQAVASTKTSSAAVTPKLTQLGHVSF